MKTHSYDKYYGILEGIPEHVLYDYVNTKYESFYEGKAAEAEQQLYDLKDALLDNWYNLKRFSLDKIKNFLNSY